MKLSQYVYELCCCLEAEHKDGQHVNMGLLPEHLAHRKHISKVLQDVFLGKSMSALDTLFDDVQAVYKHHNDYKSAHQESLKQLEAINASEPIKEKERVAGSTQKKGKIAQDKLDAAMQGLRKRRAEKKAAQKAKQENT